MTLTHKKVLYGLLNRVNHSFLVASGAQSLVSLVHGLLADLRVSLNDGLCASRQADVRDTG